MYYSLLEPLAQLRIYGITHFIYQKDYDPNYLTLLKYQNFSLHCGLLGYFEASVQHFIEIL